MSDTYTARSKIRDIYEHPVGHDVIDRVLDTMGVNKSMIRNPVISNMKLSVLGPLSGGKIGDGFFNALLTLLNDNPDRPLPDRGGEVTRKWWKEAVFYQIYPKSFMDSNGDGCGDLPGIISKLDYLKELGVTALWLCPIYDSPFDDNGYDIRDYRKIAEQFGTMEDFDRLLAEAHSRDIRIIMDLVVNHTSDEHDWFVEALNDPQSPKRRWYHFKKSRDVPNNWTSIFSGSAWNRYDEQNTWALHLFTKKQMDLNWDNAEMRAEIYKMIRWWLEKGVDGFRLDVINYISKAPGLPKGNEFIGELIGYTGIEHYLFGPGLHEHLREMRREAFEPYNAFTVGETPGVGIEMAKLLTAEYRKELDMAFSFDVLDMPGKGRYDQYDYELRYMKAYYINWMESYGSASWMSLFYDNHDNPRMLSKIDPEGLHRVPLAKLLGVIQLTLRGTPFLYQGQELGAVNRDFRDISELRDVEGLNLYDELSAKMPKADAAKTVLHGTRDHARVPMRWDSTENGGFTTGTPWLEPEYAPDGFDAQSQRENPESVWSFYKRLIALRRESEAFVYGGVRFTNENDDGVFTYYRELAGERFYIECNITSEARKRPEDALPGRLLLSNYGGAPGPLMRPYEANVYRV